MYIKFLGVDSRIIMTREYFVKFNCDFDLLMYPFDTQVCDMQLQVVPFVHSSKWYLDIKLSFVSLSFHLLKLWKINFCQALCPFCVCVYKSSKMETD